MSDIFVGQVHPPRPGGPDDCSRSKSIVTGEKAAGSVDDDRLQDGLAVLGRRRYAARAAFSRRPPDRRPRGGYAGPMLQLVLFNVTNGLIIGAFYVLMALGLSLIINLSNVINFAHGNFLAIGGYIAFMLTPYLGFWGALLVSPFLTAIFGYMIEGC